MIKSIEYIVHIPDQKLSRNKKLEFFTETRHAFGRTALVLSGENYILMKMSSWLQVVQAWDNITMD